MESWAQFPFEGNWSLFVSDIPYDAGVQNGDNILSKLINSDVSAHDMLHELASLKAGTVKLYGSKQHTRSRNAVLVMVSVASQKRNLLRSALRLASTCISIATFMASTAFFASVNIVAPSVATMVFLLILAVVIYGRASTEKLVSYVSKTEPLIHVIVDTKQEAHRVIARILSLDRHDNNETGENEVRKVQVELGGHVFVNQQLVGRRSPWVLRTLGVLATPFDLMTVDTSRIIPYDRSELELSLMQEQRLYRHSGESFRHAD